MTGFSSPAILLRRTDYADYDLILTLLTLEHGKLTAIAKYAKKSAKRFAGILELFSELKIVCSRTGRDNLTVLQEASVEKPFEGIRSNIVKTAYASYWAELVNEGAQPGEIHAPLYHLLRHMLTALDQGWSSEAMLSVLFQTKFAKLAGISPDLERCGVCRIELEKISGPEILFDFSRGTLICQKCEKKASARTAVLAKGTIKQLIWMTSRDIEAVARLRCTDAALKQGLEFLENFVPYHLGKIPRSLDVLHQLRQPRNGG
ncbi:MAG: DNA repair protein RecO [Desulfobacterales bacterium]|jgi:DNA repair protein RecO (recombination protein O)|nr:DNA repair protein RecO [Desulfobacterales bacterium]MDD3081415.1 DNA repair protein RecO [Desulfobacterales bacterium]MDD3950730.1 DNA repair protein RecO [Desulfobacterales bacterium]MDD4463451.1 DNA repair protein RecO [Desulfobacterales bacterium]MDY0377299.1 DNA repair protein RecO [Desulfobacterales bacterium]